MVENQDRNLWNKKLIAKGIEHLKLSRSWYFIFLFYSRKFRKNGMEENPFSLDLLYPIKKTAIVGLNRAIIYSKIYGAEAGIKEINKIEDKNILENYYLYHSVLVIYI